MSRPKHTPSPWKLSDQALRGWEFRITGQVDDCEITIADVPNGLNLFTYDATTRANAQLIASAPELLSALRNALVLLSGRCTKGDIKDAVNIISAAISKADGVS